MRKKKVLIGGPKAYPTRLKQVRDTARAEIYMTVRDYATTLCLRHRAG